MRNEDPAERREEMPIGPPPVLGTWPRVYAAVVCYLVALIALFTLFTRSLNR